MFDNGFLISLSNEERRYLALEPVASDADTLVLSRFRQSSHEMARTVLFFRGDHIVKVINEELMVWVSNSWRYTYEEYDTWLQTENRQMLLPLTQRGKPKKLTITNVNAVMPFGCCLRITFGSNANKLKEINLSNPRSCRYFPIGEKEAINAIQSLEDFKAFLQHYIETCREDYFDKLEAFKNAPKVTVKYKPGDIFRVDFDRTRYGYGIITSEVRSLRKMCDLSEDHGFNHLMGVPIIVRMYCIITENPALTANDLADIPLDQAVYCFDNDIIWGTNPIVDHKVLEQEDLYFMLSCRVKTNFNGRFTLMGSSIVVEWGHASANLDYEQMSEKLKGQLGDLPLCYQGVRTSIDEMLVPTEAIPLLKDNEYDLQHPDMKDILAEVFACLGLEADTDFDQFAKKFGGLTRRQILDRTK